MHAVLLNKKITKISACFYKNTFYNNSKTYSKAASKFLFWLSFSIIVRFSQVYMSYAAFKTIFRVKAAFGIVLRVIGGFLNAAKRSSKRVTEGFLDLESDF